MSLALSAALRHATSISISKAKFSTSLLLSIPSNILWLFSCLPCPYPPTPRTHTHTSHDTHILPTLPFPSLHYSVSLSVTQPVNWRLCINECRSIEAWHDAQPYYHAFIFMDGNCKGVDDRERDCVCVCRMWGGGNGRQLHTATNTTCSLFIQVCGCVYSMCVTTVSSLQTTVTALLEPYITSTQHTLTHCVCVCQKQREGDR